MDPSEVRYDLKDKKSLAAFLQNADIRLIRAPYLFHLRRADSPLLRRQEAEQEVFTVGSEQKSALVTHEEVAEWATGRKDALICSVSHGWETREHPDPCCFQLGQLADMVSLYQATYVSEIWLFYDYTSLYQFERTTDAQEQSFQRAMDNMHVMYSHDFSLTLRIEGLTPEPIWKAMLQDETQKIPVYHEASKSIQALPLKDLMENRTQYRGRGWCKAEVEWSSARGIHAQNQRIDGSDQAEGELAGRVPLTPEAFAEEMRRADFTHRNDEGAVILLQKKIFFEKVTRCPEVILQQLREAEVEQLVKSLQHYQELRSFQLNYFQGTPALAQRLVEELLKPDTKLEELRITYADGRYGGWKGSMPGTGNALAEALGAKLPVNSTLKKIELSYNDITTQGAEALLAGLRQNKHITEMDVDYGNDITEKVRKGIQKVLTANGAPGETTFTRFWNIFPKVGRVAAPRPDAKGPSAFPSPRIKVQHESQNYLTRNMSVTWLFLGFLHLGDAEAQALAAMLRENRSLTWMNLCNNRIGETGAQALLDSLRENRQIVYLNLDANRQISAEVLKEIQEIVASNKAVQEANTKQEASEPLLIERV